MAKILGLDLGTNSIGWAIVETSEDKTFQLKEKGVRIFQEGVGSESGKEFSKAAQRTGFRAARRIKYRRKQRKINTLRILNREGFCPPLREEELKEWRFHKKFPYENQEWLDWLKTDNQEDQKDRLSLTKNPYYYRAQAIKTPLAPYELGRALYHLAQRRGFLSNRLETTREQRGKVTDGIQELNEKIEAAGCLTLGEYFYKCYEKNQRSAEKEAIRNHYTHREDHYLKEFDEICRVQKIKEPLKKELHRAIFFQRPLKSQKGLVGNCTLETNKPRCPISHPDFEEYRMLGFLNNIKVRRKVSEEKLRPLSLEEREKIIPLFYRKSKGVFKFDDIAKKLCSKGEIPAYYKSRDSSQAHWIFNFSLDTAVTGSPVTAQFIDLWGADWQEVLGESYQKRCKKDGSLKTLPEVVTDIWHALFTFDKEEKLKEFGQLQLGLDEEGAEKFSKFKIKQGYASLSLKAIRKVLPFLRKGLISSHTMFLGNLETVLGSELWSREDVQKEVTKKIGAIIDNHVEEKRHNRMVNVVIGKKREELGKEYFLYSDKFPLSDLDLLTSIQEEYGKRWNDFSSSEQEDIKNDIKSKLENNCQSGFIPIKSIKEKVARYFSIEFPTDFGVTICQKSIDKLYHPSDIETFQPVEINNQIRLGSPRVSSIRNPMAMRALFQLKKVVNTLLEENLIDKETKIHIELARNLNDYNRRMAIQRWQRGREKRKKEYKEAIAKLYREETHKEIEPTEEEIFKYQLWEEQGHICLYTGNTIGIADFIGSAPRYDIEHTLPRSLSCDDSQENKTLCESKYNRDIKKNKIPFELSNHDEILPRIKKWEEEYERLSKEIAKLRGAAKTAGDKDAKDTMIQKRHFLTIERNYWGGKYRRFTMDEILPGFKNSQLVDTGIITKYAKSYLKSVFSKVYSVKGSMVAEFREIWRIQKSFEKKDRKNHIHHCIDAITIACMTKNRYDALAPYYREKEILRAKGARKPTFSLPWQDFVQDIQSVEKDVLISHYSPDKGLTRAKKKLRKRGIIQKNNEKKIIYLKGPSVRGSLHRETFYGAIAKNKAGIVKKDKEGQVIPQYVIRKDLQSLKPGDVGNIVDKAVREKVEAAVKERGFAKAMDVTNPIWMNEEKGISIKKVRYYARLSTPIFLKKQGIPSKIPYKRDYLVQNDSNYGLTLYEGRDSKGQLKRSIQSLSYWDIAEHQRDENIPLCAKEDSKGLPLKYLIKSNAMVLFYEETPDEIQWDNREDLVKRLYKLATMASSQSIFTYHQEARSKAQLKEELPELLKEEYSNTLISGKSVFKKQERFPYPRMQLTANNFNFLLEGEEFVLSPLGDIIPRDRL